MLSAAVSLRDEAWRLSVATQGAQHRTNITSAGLTHGRAEKAVTALSVGSDFGFLREAGFVEEDECNAVRPRF